MTAAVFDDRRCTLGEGALWHPLRQQLFWFDITGRKLLTRTSQDRVEWSFEEEHSAAGWIDEAELLLASASGLWRFDLTNGTRALLAKLEQGNTATRSNDGRSDPWGGFWIGTMGRKAEHQTGAIYRFYQGQLRKLFPKITIPNAICFAPDRSHAYFTDTTTGIVQRVPLDRTGWPSGAPQVFLDLSAEGLHPDGAVTAEDGTLWIAQWGAGRVAAYSAAGAFLRAVPVPARNPTCPAFGGIDFRDLHVTSATQGLSAAELQDGGKHGQTFVLHDLAQGRAEPRVIL